ncbi:MAG: hypothetical protein KC983_03340, partial [Phycisphaerales bacterium]|nr:hypothetical protein [Phycisphaerales bacterium]
AMTIMASTQAPHARDTQKDDAFDEEIWRDLERLDQVELTPELMTRCLEIARVINPELARKLTLLRDNNPELFRKRLLINGRQLISLAQLKERDPQLYSIKVAHLLIDVEVADFASQFRDALRDGDVDQVNRLEPILMQRVNAQVILSLTERERYLDRLREHIVRLECELEDDRTAVDRLVDNRFREVLGDEVSLWSKYVVDRRP